MVQCVQSLTDFNKLEEVQRDIACYVPGNYSLTAV